MMMPMRGSLLCSLVARERTKRGPKLPLKVAFAATRSPNNLFDVPLVRNPDIAESKTDDAAADLRNNSGGER